MNEEEIIILRKPNSEKLISYFKDKGVNFIEKDEDLDNVIFVKDNKEYKIAYRLFYRFSGISAIQKEKKNNIVEYIKITDDMFYENVMKPTINKFFNLD